MTLKGQLACTHTQYTSLVEVCVLLNTFSLNGDNQQNVHTMITITKYKLIIYYWCFVNTYFL